MKSKNHFDNGCFDEMFVGVCGEIETETLESQRERRLLSKVGEMVEVKRKKEVLCNEVSSHTGIVGEL